MFWWRSRGGRMVTVLAWQAGGPGFESDLGHMGLIIPGSSLCPSHGTLSRGALYLVSMQEQVKDPAQVDCSLEWTLLLISTHWLAWGGWLVCEYGWLSELPRIQNGGHSWLRWTPESGLANYHACRWGASELSGETTIWMNEWRRIQKLKSICSIAF